MRFGPQTIFGFVMVVGLAACAMGARPGAMVADITRDTIIAEDHPLWKSIKVESVTGGRTTARPWSSNVNSDEFYQALRDSLQLHAMLTASTPRYRLQAELLDVDEPWHGINATATATARFSLYDDATKALIYQRVMAHTHEASFSESAVGQTRIRLAQEGAVKGTIQKFVSDLIATADAKSAVFRTAP